MKLSMCFFLSAAFHAALFAIPGVRTEVKKQRIFSVIVATLPEPKELPAPKPEPEPRSKPAPSRDEAAPRDEALAKPRPAGAEAPAASAIAPADLSVPEPLEIGAPLAEANPGIQAEGTQVRPVSPPDSAPPQPVEAAKPAPAAAPIASTKGPAAASEKNTLDKPRPVPGGRKQESPRPLPRTAVRSKLAAEAMPILRPDPFRAAQLPVPAPQIRGSDIPVSAPRTPPKYAYNPPPEYPDTARRAGAQGAVLLSVLIDAAGRPEKIEIIQSSGIASLDDAARRSVGGWRFHPARHGDAPVPSWVKVPIVFRLAER